MLEPIEYEERTADIGAAVTRQADPSDIRVLHAALLAGVDKLAHGVALLDGSGRARFANASALQLWARLGWTPHSMGGPLRLPPYWAQALHQVCAKGRRELLRVTTPNDVALAVVLSPLPLPHERLAFAVFGRDELCGSVELQMFALRYQLTHAETAVLRQLCRGLNAAAIALDHGVARTTVLTQIAAIRAKTQSSSIRNLLDALARMPPVRALVETADGH
jgi:DNA-binding CsgD family transcriptional regulator